MKIEMDCIPCLLRQLLEAGRMATDDKELIREFINEYARQIPEMNGRLSPLISGQFHKIVKNRTGVEDPYAEIKKKNIEMALSHFEDVRKVVENSDDPLLGSLIMSAMGNSLDAGINLNVDLAADIKRALRDGFVRSDYEQFIAEVKESGSVLIVADNAGEGVFDRLLIEELKKQDLKVVYAVRGEPVLNDITVAEARELGIDKMCPVISSGVNSPGVVLEESSELFREYFAESDLVISKGQGNLEGLTEADREIYYLLKAKCQLVADYLSVELGDLVFVLH
ncbi:MAG: damage-control phosphatase ARMT1 family protein [Halanaerobiaceae bacterium]